MVNIQPFSIKVYFQPPSLLLFLLLFCIILKSTIAQDTTQNSYNDSYIQQQLESINENTMNEEADYSNLMEDLLFYQKHPINLNKTSREELRLIPFLNDIQINNLFEHLEKNGSLLSIYELQTIAGFDLTTIHKIIPYLKVAEPITGKALDINNIFTNGEHVFLIRYGRVLEKQKGFRAIDSASLSKSKNSRYIGSPSKIYTRYRYKYGNALSFGITADKDQGELFFKNKQRFKDPWYEQALKGNQQTGFDFYSAHLFFKSPGFIKALALGDYRCNFGQGLTLWSGLSFGKSADILSIKKVGTGISPYTSVDENNFMRGIAGTFKFKQIDATAFLSHKKIDGNVLDTLPNGHPKSISSIQTTGYHSTANEIADKNALTQTILGGNLSYHGKQISIGLTGFRSQFDLEFNRQLQAYNQFEFSDKNNLNLGLDYNYVFKNINIFGEQAISKNGGMAFLNGMLIHLDRRLSITMAQRNYQRNYQNLMSNALSENTLAANEKGVYLGISVQASNSISLSAYYDRFQFSWLKYQVNGPSHGNDFVMQFNYAPSKKTILYVRWRERNKQKNMPDPDKAIEEIVPVHQNNLRVHLSYSILPSVTLKNRLELIDFQINQQKTEKGYLVYQDVNIHKIGKPYTLIFRYALFDTDSYNSAVYAYENDVLGSYSIPAYAYRGTKFYVLLNYKFKKYVTLWLRFSQTFYDNKEYISEGTLNEIEGNTKSEIKLQARIQF